MKKPPPLIVYSTNATELTSVMTDVTNVISADAVIMTTPSWITVTGLVVLSHVVTLSALYVPRTFNSFCVRN